MIKVKDLMTTDVFTLSDSDNLQMARLLMGMKKIRHIPILNSNKEFVGLITHRDLLGATISKLAEVDPVTQGQIDSNITIDHVMKTDVQTISQNEELKTAAHLLLENKYGCLPVLNENKNIIGIITESDFLKLTISLMDALESNEK